MIKPPTITIGIAAEDFDAKHAYLANALADAADLRSLIFDGLTGHNDLWLRTQLLNALDAVCDNLLRAAL